MLKPRHAVIALAILFALIGDSWGQSQRPSPSRGQSSNPPQTQTTSDQQHPTPDTRGTEQNPVIVRSIRTKDETAADESQRRQQTATNWWTIIFAGGAVFAGLVQALIFIVMIRTSRQQLRAYVFAEAHPDDQPTFNADVEIRVPLHLRNRGQTPAYRVSQWIECAILPHPLVGEPPRPDLPERFTHLDLGPTAEFLIIAHLHRGLTNAEKDGLTAGTMGIYLYGEIRYRDAFALWRGWHGERQSRHTHFRYVILSERNGRIRGLMAHPEGNHAN